MIVCDRCGKPVNLQSSLIVKYQNKTLFKKEPGRLYPPSFDIGETENHYDLCQECLSDVQKKLSEFIKQGKFNGELK